MTIDNMQQQLQQKANYNFLYLYFTTERNSSNIGNPKKIVFVFVPGIFCGYFFLEADVEIKAYLIAERDGHYRD